MSVPNIPSKINSYNVYNDAERLIGVGDEVTLPDFEAMAETISGPCPGNTVKGDN